MISRRTLEYFSFAIRVGSKLHCLPFTWKWKKYRHDYLELVDTRKWLGIAYTHIIIRILIITFIVSATLHGNFSPMANILSMFFVSIYSFSLILQYIMLTKYKLIHAFINKMLRLNGQLVEYRRMPKDAPDGLELIAKIMKIFIISALCSNFPGGVFLLKKGVGVFGILHSPYASVNILVAFIWTCMQATDWTLTLFYAYLTVIYVNYASQWVGSLKWRPNMRHTTKVAFRLIYRASQVLHQTALEFFSTLMLLHISGGGLMTITSFYTVIRFPSNKFRSNLPILLRVGLTGFLTVIQFTVYQSRARETRESSEDYPHSFLKNETHVRKYDKVFFKSCRPIKFQTGELLSYCRRDFFLIFMEGIVIRQTINLLLAFK